MQYILACSTTIVLIMASQLAAIVTSEESDKFIVAPDELAYGVDLSGVVMIGGLQFDGTPTAICSGSLITDWHVLSAAHASTRMAMGRSIPHCNFSPTRQWPPQWPHERGDLAILTLTQSAPAWASRYPLYGGDQEIGEPFVIAGDVFDASVSPKCTDRRDLRSGSSAQFRAFGPPNPCVERTFNWGDKQSGQQVHLD